MSEQEGNGDGFVRITLRDVYESVEAVKHDVALLVMAAQNAGTLGKDHEDRLRSVEKRVWALPSIATLIALGSLILALLSFQGDGAPVTLQRRPAIVRTTTTTTPRADTPTTTAPVRAALPAVRVENVDEKTDSTAPGAASSSPTTVRRTPGATTPRLTTTTTRPLLRLPLDPLAGLDPLKGQLP